MDYLKLRLDWDEITKELSCKERGRLLEGLLFYVKNRTEPTLSGNERFYFSIFKARIDGDIFEYEKSIIARRKNGSKGGRPKKSVNCSEITGNNLQVFAETENNLPVSKEKEGEKENEKKKERTKEKRKEKEREAEKETHKGASREGRTVCMEPPSVDEVKAYCLERRNNVDAEAFVAYYTSNGWRVGKNPMRDWHAAIHTWERKNIEINKGDFSYEDAKFKPLSGFRHGSF